MNYPEALVSGELISRYKRFLADVRLEDGQVVTAHCPNTGRMTGCNAPGSPVRLLPSHNPKRKLPWTLEQVCTDGVWIGVNPVRSNALVAEAIEHGIFPSLVGYSSLRRERPYGTNSRIDILLEAHPGSPEQVCFVEVKSTTLRRGSAGRFPDAVTERGRKHLDELAEQAERGQRAVIVWCVQRADCAYFEPADDIDPAYGRTLRSVLDRGVEGIACEVAPSETRLEITRVLPVRLPVCDGSA